MISIPVKQYHGRDPRKCRLFEEHLRAAQKLEEWFRQHAPADRRRIFAYGTISNATGIPVPIIRELLLPVGGGENGITLSREDA